ncbi:MAG: hypothetical protein MI799_06450 [Desulfobacterales bacterium]|nr:hypothetical protein [Desulfobacterales bacterium]
MFKIICPLLEYWAGMDRAHPEIQMPPTMWRTLAIKIVRNLIGPYSTLISSVAGPQAKEAIAFLKFLAENKFNENDEENLPVKLERTQRQSDPRGNTQGAIAGIAIGPVVHYRSRLPEVKNGQVRDTGPEIKKRQATPKAGIWAGMCAGLAVNPRQHRYALVP